jgi:membrane-associated protein
MILLEIILLDHHLQAWTAEYGIWIYGIVFLVVFCETGLVVTPFLPGDSLLFALGALTVVPDSPLTIPLLSLLLLVAAFLGDNANYFLGRKFGDTLFQNPKGRFLNPKNLERTQSFYQRHGKKAIIMARFVPLVRTFVPFVAGVGRMPYRQYLLFSFLGSVLWTQLFLWAGAEFGQIPAVQKHFQLVILGVIFVSVLPPIWGWIRARRARTT